MLEKGDRAPDFTLTDQDGQPRKLDAPVSGHVPIWDEPGLRSAVPEHDWGHAAGRFFPVIVPAGTGGSPLGELDVAAVVATGSRGHLQPLLDPGPAGLLVKCVIPADGYDVTVNAEHMISWSIDAAALREASLANLARWRASAGWSVETSGGRRLISSSIGGWDASRILLASERAHMAGELAGEGRVLVGLPERHLLVAGALRPGDEEFATLLTSFIADQAAGADEPIDDRLLERLNSKLAGRPDLMGDLTSLTLHEGMTGMTEDAFISVKNRSFTVTAELAIPRRRRQRRRPGAGGPLRRVELLLEGQEARLHLQLPGPAADDRDGSNLFDQSIPFENNRLLSNATPPFFREVLEAIL